MSLTVLIYGKELSSNRDVKPKEEAIWKNEKTGNLLFVTLVLGKKIVFENGHWLVKGKFSKSQKSNREAINKPIIV